MIKITINPKPNSLDYDIHIPIVNNIQPNKTKEGNTTEKEISELFKNIDKDRHVMLCDNGGPLARMEDVQRILKKEGYKNISIDHDFKLKNFYKKQKLFKNEKPFKLFKLPALKTQTKDLFNFYKAKEWKQEILEKFFLGHYHRGQTMWTQVQSNTDISYSNNFDLMEKMQKICKTTTVLLKQILQNNGLNCENIEDRVTLRLIDYINIEKKINNTLRTHIDSSVITIILDHDSPNLIVNSFTNNSFSIKNLSPHNISKEILHDHIVLLSGYNFCHEFQTFVPACWHCVQIPNIIDRRLSLVARIEQQ